MSRFIITEGDTVYRDVTYDRERIVGLLTRDDDEVAWTSEQLAAMTDSQLAGALESVLADRGTVWAHINEAVTENGNGRYEYEVEVKE